LDVPTLGPLFPGLRPDILSVLHNGKECNMGLKTSTYAVVLVPAHGGQSIRTQIQATSDSEARRIAEAQFSGYKVTSIVRVWS
jgi:hypothetical protein